MRLGIRRKLIGTLVLVGMFPLALSLAVILLGGARLRLGTIQQHYRARAVTCAQDLAVRIDEQLRRAALVASLPQVVTYARRCDALRAKTLGPNVSLPDKIDRRITAKWKSLRPAAHPLHAILNNPLSDSLRLISRVAPNNYQLFATDKFGDVIGADVKPRAYFVGNQKWWKAAYDHGHGEPLVSGIRLGANGRPLLRLAVPVVDRGTRRVLGIIRETISAAFLLRTLRMGDSTGRSSSQIYNTVLGRTMLSTAGPGATKLAQRQFLKNRNAQQSWWQAFFSGVIMGHAKVHFRTDLRDGLRHAQMPAWTVVVSRKSDRAMAPLYTLAATVGAIGVVLIALLFIVGVMITNREVIAPLLRLREATAAVARGELNVRLRPDDNPATDPFSTDELGDLARDFDNMTRQLQRNMNQMARANEAKKRFMELAGHELRTPVTYIIGVCELALRQLQPPPASDGHAGSATVAPRALGAAVGALQKVSAKTGRLNRIVDNLLKLVNNDQFTTRLQKSPFDMRELLLQVANEGRPFLAERHEHLQLDIPDELPPFEGDREKLEDVLTNLLSNAIRFSPDHATVRLAAHVVVGDLLEIIVEDAGPGIPAAELAHLFEPFYTGDDILHHHSGTYEYGSKGIGLGLAIVRRFVELHGGVVRAQSTPTGTQFQIILPLPAGAEGAPADAPAGTDDPGATKTGPPTAAPTASDPAVPSSAAPAAPSAPETPLAHA